MASSLTAATQVLRNIDLLREIFQNLESGPKLQLLAVALTCRAFAEPAQDSLWKTMHSLMPFFKLMSMSFLSLSDNAQDPNLKQPTVYIADNRPLDSYPRFQAHAVRVQAFEFDSKRESIPLATVRRLKQLQGSKRLFPALRHIAYQSDATVFEDVILLLDSRITSFSLRHTTTYTKGQFTPICLTVLDTLKASLTEVYLCGLGQLSSSTLKGLGALFKLRSLTISAFHVDNMGAANLPLPALRNLEELNVKAPQQFLIRLLMAVGSPKLTKVALVPTDRSPWQPALDPESEVWHAASFWHACAQIISNKWRDTITSLTFDDAGRLSPFVAFDWRTFAELLYPVSKLEVLDVGVLSMLQVHMTDEDYVGMASAWPSLETLHIQLPYIPPPPFAQSGVRGGFGSGGRFPSVGAAAIPAHAPQGFQGIHAALPPPPTTTTTQPPIAQLPFPIASNILPPPAAQQTHVFVNNASANPHRPARTAQLDLSQIFAQAGPPPLPPHPTALALVIIATNFPRLKSLQIYLPSTDYTSPTLLGSSPDELERVLGHSTTSSLEKVWLGNCKVDSDPSTTATHLQNLFPKLQSVMGVCASVPGKSEAVKGGSASCGFEWINVQRCLVQLRDIRRRERERVMRILEEEGVRVGGKAQKRIY